jgi:ATP-dependent helicase HepA
MNGPSARLVRELLDRHAPVVCCFAIPARTGRHLLPTGQPPDEYMELPIGEHADPNEVSYQAQPDVDEEQRWWKFDPRV